MADQETAAGPGRVVKPLAEAPLLGGKSCCTPRTPQGPPAPLRDPPRTPQRPPASLGRRPPVQPVPDPLRLLLGIPCLLQAIPPLPLRLHRQHFVDLIMR